MVNKLCTISDFFLSYRLSKHRGTPIEFNHHEEYPVKKINQILYVFLLFTFSLMTQAVEDYDPEAEKLRAEMAAAIKKADPKVIDQMNKGNAKVAKQLPKPGLKVGMKAPDFKLKNQDGNWVKLQDLLKKGPVIISFYRGAWCPYCNLQINNLVRNYDHFKPYNAQLVAITPQKPDKSLLQYTKAKVPFPILSDLDNKVMKDYNVLFHLPDELIVAYSQFGIDLADYNGEKRWVLPVPATYILDQKGIIRSVFADIDYTKRMEPKVIVATLAKL